MQNLFFLFARLFSFYLRSLCVYRYPSMQFLYDSLKSHKIMELWNLSWTNVKMAFITVKCYICTKEENNWHIQKYFIIVLFSYMLRIIFFKSTYARLENVHYQLGKRLRIVTTLSNKPSYHLAINALVSLYNYYETQARLLS